MSHFPRRNIRERAEQEISVRPTVPAQPRILRTVFGSVCRGSEAEIRRANKAQICSALQVPVAVDAVSLWDYVSASEYHIHTDHTCFIFSISAKRFSASD